MNRANYLSLLTIIGIFSLILSSCETGTTQDLPPTPDSPITPALTHTLSPSAIPEETFTPTAPLTVPSLYTPTPIEFEIIPTSIKHPGKWNLAIPYSDPNSPEIIISTSDGIRLNPAFEVQSIDLLYEWWGLGDPVFDYQKIERRDSNFWHGDKEVSASSVKNLIDSITNLHPQPQMLTMMTHTDDYPTWSIELTLADNTHMLLYSNSNGPFYAPWNVIYNGQIFTQFDGQITNAIAALFEITEGQPMAWTYIGNAEEGYSIVDTAGWPGQLSNSFSGLLPMQSGFSYWPDIQEGEIYGYFEGRSSIGGMGNMIVGSITDLQKIEVEIDKDQLVTCTLNKLTSYDPTESTWEFICPVGKSKGDESYRYPIEVTFRTDQDQTYTSVGELFGYWENRIVLPARSYPEEIGKILSESPAVKDLTTDHEITVFSFNAAADPVTGLMDHRWTAEIVLLGQADMGTRILPYSVAIEVEIEDGELVHWDLDRPKLYSLLHDVLNQPITRRFLDGDPNLVLNLYYGENANHPIVDQWNLQPCADLPVADGLPNAKQSLRGFAFNQPWNFYGMQILMIDDKLRIDNLRIEPLIPQDAIWNSLLPVELQPENAPPFRLITLWSFSPTVNVYWDSDASATDISIYQALAETWQGNKEINSWGASLDPGMLGITTDGQLALVSCTDP